MIERLQAARARFWVIIVPIFIGLLLIVLLAMGVFYFQQKQELQSLEEQVAQLRSQVAIPVVISDELKANYAEAEEAIPGPGELSTDDVILDILSIAEANGFDVSGVSEDIKISAREQPRTEEIAGTNYQVLTFEVSVSERYDRVTNFIFDLDATSVLKTLVIESVDIDIEQDNATAQIQVGVYTLEE